MTRILVSISRLFGLVSASPPAGGEAPGDWREDLGNWLMTPWE
jgi:hypothetical protein